LIWNGSGWLEVGDEYTPSLSGAIDWINGSFTKIVVGIDHERDLLQMSRDADYFKIPHALIKDDGRTEFKGTPTYTALAIGPDWSNSVDRITGHLSLV
jgi:PTH2 family peptidyl-tRNA hydrolase